MDKFIKKQWISKLRNPRYTQVREALRQDGPAYCCLGVLGYCVLKKATSQLDDENGKLGPTVRKEVGMTYKQESRLIELNDSKGWDFKQIANWIEKYL